MEVDETWLSCSQSVSIPLTPVTTARCGKLCVAGTAAALRLGTCRAGARNGLEANVSGRMGEGRSDGDAVWGKHDTIYVYNIYILEQQLEER